MTEKQRMSKRGEWKPMDDRHKNDRVIFLSVQSFISWVNRVLEEKND